MAPPGAQSQQLNALQDEPPYRPQVQSLGGTPSIIPDVPINAVFLLLFAVVGVAHATLLWRNLAAKKKFLISIMITVFCITRMAATSLRIAWACHSTDIRVAIAAMIFVYAGIVLLFLANLFFSQRIVRAQHPRFGWSKPISILFPVVFGITVATIICLIVAVIIKFYTLNPGSLHAATIVQKYGACWLAVAAFLPTLIAGASALARRHPHIRMTKTTDKFGEGSMRVKVAIVIVSSLLLSLGASFRAATILLPPVPLLLLRNPPQPAPQPWYLSKACFYIFNFSIEISVCLLWLAMRIDKRFLIPDGANGAFSYAGGFVFAGEAGNEKKRLSNGPGSLQQLSGSTSMYKRDSHRSSRISLTSQKSKLEKLERKESRISWGGVAPEGVKPIFAEDGKREIPYPAKIEDFTEDDLAVDGVEKEMGWDPKTGKWATRSLVNVSKTGSRPVSTASTLHQASEEA